MLLPVSTRRHEAPVEKKARSIDQSTPRLKGHRTARGPSAVTLLGIRPPAWRLIECPPAKRLRAARYQSPNPKLNHISPGAPKGYSYLTESISAPGEQQRPRLTRISWLRASPSFFDSDRV